MHIPANALGRTGETVASLLNFRKLHLNPVFLPPESTIHYTSWHKLKNERPVMTHRSNRIFGAEVTAYTF